jgi:hypothetical protein
VDELPVIFVHRRRIAARKRRRRPSIVLVLFGWATSAAAGTAIAYLILVHGLGRDPAAPWGPPPPRQQQAEQPPHHGPHAAPGRIQSRPAGQAPAAPRRSQQGQPRYAQKPVELIAPAVPQRPRRAG